MKNIETEDRQVIYIDELVNSPDWNEITVVYLDQWVWIELAQASADPSHRWRPAHDTIVRQFHQGNTVFPFSFSHLVETTKRVDDESRGRLVDFMASVWGGHSLRPWPNMLMPEARNAVRFMLDEPSLELRSKALGLGIGHMLGTRPTLKAKNPKAKEIAEGILKQLVDAVMGPEAWLQLKISSHAASLRESGPNEEEVAKELQRTIDDDYSHPDKAIRNKLAGYRSLTGQVGDALVRAMFERTSDPKQLMDKALTSREQIERLRLEMPTFHTFYELNHRRNSTAKVKSNDTWDFSLSIAIPYCDIVATERSWCNIAKQAKLHRIYGTSLVHSPNDLVNALENVAAS